MNRAVAASALFVTTALLLSACADPDRVLFVTDTKIAIDVDRAPPNANIGYSRDETFIGPNFEETSGGLPPVVGQLKSNLAPLNPQVEQIYATGQAATLVTHDAPVPLNMVCQHHNLASPKRLAFFRTGANIGLKIVFGDQYPESVTFGYKRKELSFIPLAKINDPKDDKPQNSTTDNESHDAKDIYGSVIAFINLDTEIGTIIDWSTKISQFIATGCPAEQLAATNKSIRDAFEIIAAQGVTPTATCIKTWLDSDKNHPQQLESWWNDKSLQGSAVPKINDPEFKQQRLNFIADKEIPCNL
jgi:hypothetical protein